MSPRLLAILPFAALPLAIPIAVIVGHRRPNGAIIVSAGATFAAFAVLWLVWGGPVNFGGAMLPPYILVASLALWLAAWALALNASAQARRWRWVALLVLAGSLTIGAVAFSLALPPPCPPGLPDGSTFYGPACSSNPTQQLLIAVCVLAGPAAALAYGFGLRARRTRRGLPDGLSASPVVHDDSLELRTERL
ncbi:MAG: hypothetical protein ACHQ4H_19275 [Ktedonobacterales bacterium]